MNASDNTSLDVLVVEDHSSTRDFLCRALGLLGHAAHCVATGESAVASLGERKFDLVVADLSLPGISGFDVARFAVGTHPGIGIVFISGFGYLVADKTEFPFVLLPKPCGVAQLKDGLAQARRIASGPGSAGPAPP